MHVIGLLMSEWFWASGGFNKRHPWQQFLLLGSPGSETLLCWYRARAYCLKVVWCYGNWIKWPLRYCRHLITKWIWEFLFFDVICKWYGVANIFKFEKHWRFFFNCINKLDFLSSLIIGLCFLQKTFWTFLPLESKPKPLCVIISIEKVLPEEYKWNCIPGCSHENLCPLVCRGWTPGRYTTIDWKTGAVF